MQPLVGVLALRDARGNTVFLNLAYVVAAEFSQTTAGLVGTNMQVAVTLGRDAEALHQELRRQAGLLPTEGGARP